MPANGMPEPGQGGAPAGSPAGSTAEARPGRVTEGEWDQDERPGMSDTTPEERDSGQSAANARRDRVFLVIVDDTEELPVALRYASLRAKNTGGRVALLRVVEPAEFQHWMGVGELMQEERRQEAEALLQRLSEQVVELCGKIPVIYVREGRARDEVMALINEEPSISILVLAAGTGKEGPGPLVTYLIGKAAMRIRVPITVVPGNLTEEQIDALT